MAIEPLPSTSTIKISSGQGILDPSSVVKELIDNAIDARATAVSIDISANTLDSIQVRDNGFGINPDDRGLIGKRYCTSKIRSLQDLEMLGGSSLGFRGEALSSLVSVAQRVEVCTRIDGERVGVKLVLCKNESKDQEETVSHAVGTTVKAVNLFQGLPVRKQTAEKDAVKILGRIRKLIHAYILAEPAVRFSMRVLKSTKDKFNVTYAPLAAGPNVEDVAIKTFGTTLATNCSWTEKMINSCTFQVFHPSPNCSVAEISGIGHFLSIDSRPVSARAGVLKDILSTYRKRLRNHNSAFSEVKEPFLSLNIVCPPGSYDINVEPLKTDLLFAEPEELKSAADTFFSAVYPTQLTEPREGALFDLPNDTSSTTEAPLHTVSRDDGRSTEAEGNSTSENLPFSNRSPLQMPSAYDQDFIPDNAPFVPPLQQLGHQEIDRPVRSARWFSQIGTMHGFDEDELENMPPQIFDDTAPPYPSSRTEPQDTQSANPWSLAKMNTKIRAPSQSSIPSQRRFRPPLKALSQNSSRRSRNSFAAEDVSSVQQSPARQQRYSQRQLPTPLPSSSPVGPASSNSFLPVRTQKRGVGRISNRVTKPPRSTRTRAQLGGEADGFSYPSLSQEHDQSRDIRGMLRAPVQHELDPPVFLEDNSITSDIESLLNDLRQSSPIPEVESSSRRSPSVRLRGPEVEPMQSIRAVSLGLGASADLGSRNLEQPMSTDQMTASQRAFSTGLRRTRSSMLPLNHVPVGTETHNLVISVTTASAHMLRRLVNDGTLETILPWKPMQAIIFDTNLPRLCNENCDYWASKLNILIQAKFPSSAELFNEEEISKALRTSNYLGS